MFLYCILKIAARLGKRIDEVKNITIWGNHSSTQYPDVNHGTVLVGGAQVPICEAVKNDNYLHGEFIKTVQTRGAAIISARKLSSAMSAAKAICDHMRDWWFGTSENEWVSMGVVSDGSYGIPKDIIYSFPVKIDNKHDWTIVQGLDISDFSRAKMDATASELLKEKDAVSAFF
ncbi:hypothetical protein QZH41_007655 [Actinostola sp. cb2023]|nr:hypothetical protein QZH41_007655 [Actinostola sp. cb2023]